MPVPNIRTNLVPAGGDGSDASSSLSDSHRRRAAANFAAIASQSPAAAATNANLTPRIGGSGNSGFLLYSTSVVSVALLMKSITLLHDTPVLLPAKSKIASNRETHFLIFY